MKNLLFTVTTLFLLASVLSCSDSDYTSPKGNEVIITGAQSESVGVKTVIAPDLEVVQLIPFGVALSVTAVDQQATSINIYRNGEYLTTLKKHITTDKWEQYLLEENGIYCASAFAELPEKDIYSICSNPVAIPSIKLKPSYTRATIPKHIKVVLGDSGVARMKYFIESIETESEFAKEAVRSRFKDNFVFSGKVDRSSAGVCFTRFDDLSDCLNENDDEIGLLEEVARHQLDDEFILVPRLSHGHFNGYIVVGDSLRAWLFAIDTLGEISSDKNLNRSLYFIHDYPSSKVRDTYSTYLASSLADWEWLLDISSRLRLTSISIPLLLGNKLLVDGPTLDKYSEEMFDPTSPFIEDAGLIEAIIELGKLKGVRVVPTVTHLSGLNIAQYYPAWTLPNGVAIDWRNSSAQQFLADLLAHASSYRDVEQVSVWGDEGGAISVQPDFIGAVYDAAQASGYRVDGEKQDISLLVTPIIASAVRTGAITDLQSLLPANVRLDLYGGVGSDESPGTYHITNPQYDVTLLDHLQLSNNNLNFTATTFTYRSRFNGIEFPYFSYLDAAAQLGGGAGASGNYLFGASSYDRLSSPALQYAAHRAWAGDASSLDIIRRLPSDFWVNAEHTELLDAWDDMMSYTLGLHFQKLMVVNFSRNESQALFDELRSKMSSAPIQFENHIAQLFNKIELLKELVQASSSEISAPVLENIDLSLLTADSIANLLSLVVSIQNFNVLESTDKALIANRVTALNVQCDLVKTNFAEKLTNWTRHPACVYQEAVATQIQALGISFIGQASNQSGSSLVSENTR